MDLVALISAINDGAIAMRRTGVNDEELVKMLTRGQVIAHVDGNHWVRPLSAFTRNGKTWVRVYDSGRGGSYDQLLDSFMTRPTASTPWIQIVGE